jgi:hypothetical protein
MLKKLLQLMLHQKEHKEQLLSHLKVIANLDFLLMRGNVFNAQLDLHGRELIVLKINENSNFDSFNIFEIFINISKLIIY